MYYVVGVGAFLLGLSVTLLACRWNNPHKKVDYTGEVWDGRGIPPRIRRGELPRSRRA